MSSINIFKPLPGSHPVVQRSIKERKKLSQLSEEKKILEDSSASFWLKEQIVRSNKRDVVDALTDAEMLVEILKARYNAQVQVSST